jgi:transcriptional regulator with XRE-family HTH domain
MPRKTQTDSRLLEVYRTIGDNIFRKRGLKKMTQDELAKAAGVSLSTVRGAETGLGCQLEKLIKIAEALGCNAGDLFITDAEHKEVTRQHIMLMDMMAKAFTGKNKL